MSICGANAIAKKNEISVNPTRGNISFTQRLYTAYLGAVNVQVQYGKKEGTVLLEYQGVGTNTNIVIKCVDAVASHIDYTTRPSLRRIEGKPAVIVDIKKNKDNYYNIQLYELQKAYYTGDKLGIDRRKKAIYAFYINEPAYMNSSIQSFANYRTTYETDKIHKQYAENCCVDIHFETGLVVQFMQEKLGRNSVNQSDILLSVCNVPNLDNAFFTGEYMVYGNGKTQFYPLGSIDIACHELTHALVTATAGLKYEGHSGAMNEHVADIIATAFEFWVYEKFNNNTDTTDDLHGGSDWLIGEDVGKSMKYLRNLKDPTKADMPQPKMYLGEYWGDPNSSTDYGYVHVNSGVLNHFFYLLSQSVGIDASLSICYNTLLRLNTTSDFIDYRNTLLDVSPESIRHLTQQALTAVGLGPDAVSDWNKSPTKNKIPTQSPIDPPQIPSDNVQYPNSHIPTTAMCCQHCQSRQHNPLKRRRT
jgi:hypothetical protein